MQFNLLTFLGLREHHYLLDVGCGSLRGGRLFISYLLTGRYFGIEPNRQLIKDGIENELGEGIIPVKRPVFSHDEKLSIMRGAISLYRKCRRRMEKSRRTLEHQ